MIKEAPTDPTEVINQSDGTVDITISADSIRAAVEAGHLKDGEELLSRLGEIGIEGHKAGAGDEPQALIAYDPEEEGGLGFIDKDEFVDSFNLAPKAKNRGAAVWTMLMQTNESIISDIRAWGSSEFLNQQRATLSGRLAKMRDPSAPSRQRLEALLGQVNDRLEGRAQGIPEAAFGSVGREPFMYLEVEDTDRPEPKLAILDRLDRIDMTKVRLSWDGLYDVIVRAEGSSHSNMGSKTRPLLINLLNSRITAARASAEVELEDPAISEAS
jgi:hypothetical protein